MYEIKSRVQLVGDKLTGTKVALISREKVIVGQKMIAMCFLIP